MNKNELSGSKICIAFLVLCAALVQFTHKSWEKPPGIIAGDVVSYYAYLPATFLYHDLKLGKAGVTNAIPSITNAIPGVFFLCEALFFVFGALFSPYGGSGRLCRSFFLFVGRPGNVFGQQCRLSVPFWLAFGAFVSSFQRVFRALNQARGPIKERSSCFGPELQEEGMGALKPACDNPQGEGYFILFQAFGRLLSGVGCVHLFFR